MNAPSMVTFTVAPFSAVPLIVGVESLVDAPTEGEMMAGALGAVVSMVIATGVDAEDSFPAASVALAVSV